MLKADRVILLDTDIWSRKGRTHRAKLRAEEGTQWINIPVCTADRKRPICEVRIDHSEDWKTPFKNGVLHNYSSATYFDFMQDELAADFKYASSFEKLIDFNLHIFNRLLTYLEIDLHYEFFSATSLTNSEYRVVYQEYASKNYIRQLDQAQPALEKHPAYRQAWPGFEPECSVLDLLLNYGPESYQVIELLY